MKDKYWVVVVLFIVIGMLGVQLGTSRIDLTGTQQRHVFWCEEGGNIGTLGQRYSWGNGNINANGVRQVWSGWCVAMSMDCENSGSTAGRVQLALNGVPQGTDYELATPGVSKSGTHLEFDTPLRFNAGDHITAETTTVDSTTNGVTIAFWVVYDY